MYIKLKQSEIFFFLAFGIWLTYKLLEANATFNILFQELPVSKFVFVVTYICLTISICILIRVKFNWKKSLFTFSYIIVSFISVYISEDIFFLLTLILFIMAARKINFHRIVKFDFIIQIICMTFTIVPVLIGISENEFRYRGTIMRFFMGYKNTLAPIFLFYIVLMFLFLKKENLKLFQVILLLGLNYFFFLESNVRSSYYFVIFVLILGFLMKGKILSQKKIWIIIATFTVPFLYLFSIGIHLFFDPNNFLYSIINVLSSSRLRLGNEAIRLYGFKLFGNSIKWNFINVPGAEYIYVDSAFLKYTLMYGILFMIIIVISLSLIMRIAWKNNDKYVCIIIFMISLNAMFNPQLLYLQYNPFILLIGFFLQNYKKQKQIPEWSC